MQWKHMAASRKLRDGDESNEMEASFNIYCELVETFRNENAREFVNFGAIGRLEAMRRDFRFDYLL